MNPLRFSSHSLIKIWLCLTIGLGLLACTAIKSKETLYPFVDHRAKYNSENIKRVMLAPINFDVPSRRYLQSHKATVDAYIIDYLKKHQYTVYNNKPFEQLWQQAEATFGVLFNRTTGRNTRAHQQAFEHALNTLFDNNPQLDAIVFADLIEVPLSYQNALQRKAEWHGVEKRIKVEGIGEGTGMSFTLEQGPEQDIEALSLMITVVDKQQRVVFQSVGGIQIVQALAASNKGSSLKRRRDLLNSEKDINHAIKIAFHPLIAMKGYPKN